MKQVILASFATITVLETLEYFAGKGVAIGFGLGVVSMLLVLIHKMDEAKK
ncbi:MAG: hypothetical protein IH622_03650 [Ochrobactrum anthropi]|uniref:Uncharacterized protein n=1 Tax=Brucella anthropi TaxID=529 RepID=A0A8I0N2Y0_BRUAN|nr:hypothetical protein [Brucella anthropi]MBE0559914.1 hypothetical protein [Brucella anthropi]